MNANTLPKLKAELDRLIEKSAQQNRLPQESISISVKVRDLPRLRNEISFALNLIDAATVSYPRAADCVQSGRSGI